MKNELATQAKPAAFDLSPQTFEQALTFAQYLADSELVPKDFKGKPGNCLVAIQWGMEIGLKPMQALQNIAVINGRPALWGDAVIALVRSSSACEYIVETQTDHMATCKVKRRGETEQERTFSMEDAKKAGLNGKQGPWAQYPKRMMQMRARAFALRDVFPDVLKGLPVAEEVMDMPSEQRDMGAAEVVQPAGPSLTLMAAARNAAAGGTLAFKRWFKTVSEAERTSLGPMRAELQGIWEKADSTRTVDNPPPAATPAPAAASTQAAKTFDEVMKMLCDAKNDVALEVAAGWIDTVDGDDDRKILEDKFNELLAGLRG